MADACAGEISLGTIFFRETTPGSGTYQTIAKVIEFPQIEMSAETKECQDPEAEAANDGYVSHYKTGRRDAGETAITLAWKSGDATQELLKTDFDSNDQINYRMQHPDQASTKVDFAALVTGWGHSTPYNDRITRTVKFRIQGKPEFYE